MNHTGWFNSIPRKFSGCGDPLGGGGGVAHLSDLRGGDQGWQVFSVYFFEFVQSDTPSMWFTMMAGTSASRA